MLRQNLSDLAGKGAKPLGYLMTTALDDAVDEAWIAKFAEGLAQDQAEFDIALWGGDTTTTPGPLALTATLIGAVPAGRALRRDGARPGDRILVTGTIGDGFFGLAAHRGELADLAEPARRFLAQRYVLPQPRVALGRMLAEQGLAHAGMDISDGLAADLGHMCAASNCGAAGRGGVGAAVGRRGRPGRGRPGADRLGHHRRRRLRALAGGAARSRRDGA